MKRRTFLQAAGLTFLAAATRDRAADSRTPDRPNILVIMTDQQFGDGMSCVLGKKYLHTPNIDSLAENGMRFTRAYSPNPLCVPMRTSMITGHYPHQTGVLANGPKKLDTRKFVLLGKLFKDAGYKTAYFGKWHIPVKGTLKDIHGFEIFNGGTTRLDPSPAAAFLAQKHDRPFLVFASFLSPHEICQWSRKQKLPGGAIAELPPVDERPPVRANCDPPENETDIITHMRKSYQAGKMFPVGNYTKDDWRRHIWGYYRLIERADGFVGTVLEGLRTSGNENNTVVVFLSDHGDCHGAHLWNQKTVFYDESARVPFIIRWPGKTPAGTSDVLLNTGIDLLPTLCDFAGIAPANGLPGKSMKAPAMGNAPRWEREYVVSENHMVQCEPVDGKKLTPHGRMVRSTRYKYCLYSEGQRRESLVDMEKDPGEMVNQAENPAFKDVLARHRAYLREHAEHNGDIQALNMLAYGKT